MFQAQLLLGMDPQTVIIAGDDPRVMATLCGWQRMRETVCQPLLAGAVGAFRMAGWQTKWQRMSRAENDTADRADRAACRGANYAPPLEAWRAADGPRGVAPEGASLSEPAPVRLRGAGPRR
jgi:hypothetical protein